LQQKYDAIRHALVLRMAYQVDSIAYLQHIYQIKLTMTMSRCSLLLGFLLLSLNLATAQQLDPCWSNDVVSTHHSGMPNEDKPDCPFTSTLQGAPQFAFSWPTFSSPNGGNGIIYAIATDGAGNWYVGGNFTLVNSSPGVSAHYIARFHAPTNTWSALGSGNGLNGEVRSIAILGNSLFVGGEFTQADAGSASPVSVSNIARFDISTNTWSALGLGAGNGVDGRVYAITTLNHLVFVGGDFTRANVGSPSPTSADHIAIFDTKTNTWSNAGSSGVNGVVYALAALGEDIFIGGDFTQVTGRSSLKATGIVRFHTKATQWSNLGSCSGVSGTSQPAVYAIAVSGEDVFIGGEFTQVNVGSSLTANYIARFNTARNTWSALGTAPGNGVNGAVNAIAVLGEYLFVGGFFTKANLGATSPVMASYIARYNLSTNAWSVFSSTSSINNEVYAIASSGQDVFIGGNFSPSNPSASSSAPTSVVVRFNVSTNTWSVIGLDIGHLRLPQSEPPSFHRMFSLLPRPHVC
jgi:N-acetylneuraminic acid mutarotase